MEKDFVGIAHKGAKTHYIIKKDQEEHGTNSLEELAHLVVNRHGKDFENKVTLDIPEDLGGAYELTDTDAKILHEMILKELSKNK